MLVRSIQDVEAVWLRLESSKRVSDGLIRFGPFGVGVNGFIAMFTSFAAAIGGPFGAVSSDALFELYTVVMVLYLMVIAAQVRASPGTAIKVAVYMLLDGLTDTLPVLGGVLDTFFRFPRMAAHAIQKEIERTHWVEESWREARASGDYQRHWDDARAQRKSRVVFLRA